MTATHERQERISQIFMDAERGIVGAMGVSTIAAEFVSSAPAMTLSAIGGATLMMVLGRRSDRPTQLSGQQR